MHRSLCHHLEATSRRCHAWAATSRSSARGQERGLTLIELLVTIALIAVVTSGVVMGSGAVGGARLRGAASMINGAVRIAFTRASATSKANRLVFDLEKSMVILEETGQTVLMRKEAAAGSQGVTAEERDAQEQTSRILKGPQISRPRFTPVKALGFDDPDTTGGRALGKGVKFRRVETGHMPTGKRRGAPTCISGPGGGPNAPRFS